mgnify:CR=1 FL=1
MKKIISLLLVLVLALSMIPMAAAAATMPKLDSNRYITYTDKDGRYFIADSTTGESDFFYYVTIKETESSFWMVQFVCPGEVAEKHVDSMAQWSSTFAEIPAAE